LPQNIIQAMTYKTPTQTLEAICEVGKKKSSSTIDQMILLGFMAGVFISLGGQFALVTGGNIPKVVSENPGISRLLFGATFPVGLMLVIVTGTDLFTGVTMVLVPPLLARRMSILSYLKTLIVSYLSNAIGCVAIAYFIIYWTQSGTDPWVDTVKAIAVKKCHGSFGSRFFPLMLSGIAANFLVTMAVYAAIAADDITGKFIAIWFPVAAFVACGFEHSIANWFFVPLGLFYKADVEWWRFPVVNLIPVTIGNAIGGSIFVGLVFW
jgi:formate/nitrite transporter